MGATEDRISKLHPIVAKKATEVVNQARAEGIRVIITQGLRTMDEQAALYAQGRTTPGAIVTNARAGYSYHNYGLAFDYALLDDNGVVSWDVNDKWKRVAAIGKGKGFDWGGDWTGTLIDYPHLEMTFGLSVRDLLNGKKPPTETEEDPVLNKDLALNIIDSYLSPAWLKYDAARKEALNKGDSSSAEANLKLRDWQRTLANALRDAAKIEY